MMALFNVKTEILYYTKWGVTMSDVIYLQMTELLQVTVFAVDII